MFFSKVTAYLLRSPEFFWEFISDVIWRITILHLITNPSSLFYTSYGMVPGTSTSTFLFHSLFSSKTRAKCLAFLFLFFFFFVFLWSARTSKSFFLLTLGLIFYPWFRDLFVFQDLISIIIMIIIIIILLIWEFFAPTLADGFPLVSEWLQVSMILFSILTALNALVWVVSTRPAASKSSSLCTSPLVTVSITAITIGIAVTFMFHRFFSYLASSLYLPLLLLFTD